jgi:phosphoglycolate phosphatase-like HAD superfamily hydrolase
MSVPLDAILFDVDGVLIDSLPIKGEAFAAAFDDRTDLHDQIVAFHLANGGVNRTEKIAQLYALAFGRAPASDELSARVDAFARAVYDGVVRAPEIPGAAAALSSWSGKVPLHAVSATPQDELSLILVARGIAPYLTTIEGWPPPKVELVGSLIRRCGYQPERCLVVGDSREDLVAAKTAGALFVHVCSSELDGFPEANAVIRDLRGLDAAIQHLVGPAGE